MATKGFDGYIHNVVMSSHTTLALAYASRLGLFESMAAINEPKTLQQLATATKLKEGMLKELLLSLVTANVLKYEASNKTFFLPPDRLTALRRMRGECEYTMHFYSVFNEVLEAFPVGKPGAKIPDSFWDESHSVFNLYSECINDPALVKSYISNVPGLTSQLESGIEVGDFGCGGGDFLVTMASAFPKSKFQGLDLNKESIQKADDKVKDAKLTNITFTVGDVTSLPKDWAQKFDFVYSNDCLHHIKESKKAAAEITNTLKSGGYLSQFDCQFNPKPESHVGNLWTNYLNMFSLTYNFFEDGSSHESREGWEHGGHDEHGGHHEHGDQHDHGSHHEHTGHHEHGGDHEHGSCSHEENNDGAVFLSEKDAEDLGLTFVGTFRLTEQPVNIQNLYQKK